MSHADSDRWSPLVRLVLAAFLFTHRGGDVEELP